jgi:DNA adenine methylase
MKTFLRYPGNKSRLLKQIRQYIPDTFNTYYEPFLGSGAIFLDIKPKKAVLNDLNKDVYTTWKQVQQNPDKVMKQITLYSNTLKNKQSREEQRNYAKDLTGKLNTTTNEIDRVSMYIFLKQMAYNGHLKSNTRGYYFHGLEMNSKSWFSFLNGKKHLISQASVILPGIKITNKDYKEVLTSVKKNDFVYLDPPYIHSAKTPIVYNKNSIDEIILLQDILTMMNELNDRGAKVMLSMSDYPIVRSLFNGYVIKELKVYRTFKKIYEYELLIMNYT